MTTLAPILAVLALLPFALASSPPEMAAHTGERPPNPPAYVYQQRITESAQPPSALAEELPPSDTTAYEPPAPSAPSQRVTGASFAEVEQLTADQMRDLAPLAGFTEELIPALLAVTWCESKFSPGAVGGAGEAGLGQIHPVNWRRFDQFADPNPWDPLQNLIVTYQMSQGGTNWWAWTCRP